MDRANRVVVTAAVTAAFVIGAAGAQASDSYSFPGATHITAAVPISVAPNSDGAPMAPLGAALSMREARPSHDVVPPVPTSGRSYDDRFGARSGGADARAYQFLADALRSSSYANYAADYARLFAPGYAVSAWTDRVYGVIDVGYGGAVNSWTAAAYYLPRVGGPSRRRESVPDLSVMPAFRPHPELQTSPTFEKRN